MSQHTWHVRVLTGQAVTPTSRSTLTGAELPQGEKVLHLCAQGYFVSVRLFITLQTGPARLLCQGGGFSRQEYWSVLANTGCHTLLEHYISCSPSYQLPLVAGAARIPVTQATAQPPHLALNVADPNPPRQPQEQTPVDDPHAKVEIKPLLKPRGSVAKEEDSKPSHPLYKLHIKST